MTRGVHGHDAFGGASLEVKVVVTGAGTDDDLQVVGVVDDFLRHLVGTDDEGIGVGNGLVEVIDIGIFLQKSQFIAVLLNDFADAVNGDLGERLFSCN